MMLVMVILLNRVGWLWVLVLLSLVLRCLRICCVMFECCFIYVGVVNMRMLVFSMWCWMFGYWLLLFMFFCMLGLSWRLMVCMRLLVILCLVSVLSIWVVRRLELEVVGEGLRV